MGSENGVADGGHGHAAPCRFTFDGETFEARPGQSIAGALHAGGQYVLSRSFKYHRPRGLFCVSGRCPNCLCTVNGEPNVRICTRAAEPGQDVRSQNAWPSLDVDALNVFDKLHRMMPVGFYYKRMYKPRKLWPLYEKVIRNIAGLGEVDFDHGGDGTYDKLNLFVDVAVVGGGVAGLQAALAAAEEQLDVLLVDDQPALGGHLRHDPDLLTPDFPELLRRVVAHPRIQVVTSATAFGLYEGNYLGIQQGKRLIRARAHQTILATGGWERPLVLENNDLPGILLASGAQRLLHLDGCRFEGRAVVVTNNAQGYRIAAQLERAGTKVAAIVDLNELAAGDPGKIPVHAGKTILAARGGRHVRAAVVGSVNGGGKSDTIRCRWIIQALGFTPATSLLYQSGSKLRHDAQLDHPAVTQFANGVHACGAVLGTHDVTVAEAEGKHVGLTAALAIRGDADTPLRARRDAAAAELARLVETKSRPGVVGHYVSGSTAKKKFVCLCEDVTEKDVYDAIDEGYANVETLKRYSTISMGPCQGKMCQAAAIGLCAAHNGKSIEETGTTTSRPPEQPLPLGVLAGRGLHFSLVRRTAVHHWHEQQGAKFLDAGTWKRPESYGDPAREYEAVRHRVGLIDVSTLGKIELRGRDVGKFLEFIYPNRFEKLKPGRVRYGVICDDAGIVLDDGIIARLEPERFFLTTTTGNADAIDSWFRSWLVVKPEWDVRMTNMSTCYAGMNVAGPRSRDVLSKICDANISAHMLPYGGVAEFDVAGVRAVVLRIGFVGELGFEIHVPTQFGQHVWDALLAAGKEFDIEPFGVEAQRRLRLEKKHFLPGVDTDALSNPIEADVPWIVKLDKPDFIGKWSLTRAANRPARNRLIGFRLDGTTVPDEASLVISNGRLGGRVTSARYSPVTGGVIGLAWVPAEQSANGDRIEIQMNGRRMTAVVQHAPFYDPEEARLNG